MAWIAAAIAGVAGLVGGSEMNSANKSQSVDQMRFQRDMANTAYQRQTADLNAAGLNPMLGYMKGGGVATPEGARAVIQDRVTPAVNSAMTSYRLGKEMEALDATVAKTQAETQQAQTAAAKNQAEAAVAAVTVPRIEAQTATERHTARKVEEETANVAVSTEKLSQEVAKVVAERHVSEETASMIRAQTRQALLHGDLTYIETGNAKLDAELKRLTREYLQLGLPRERNLSDVQGDWWFKTISPYLPDVLKSTGTAASVLRLGK